MKYRKLANTGTSVSNLALGAMEFGTKVEESEAFAILDRFVEAGGNLIDTANVYGGGTSEELLGRWFASRPADITERVVLATTPASGPAPTSTKPAPDGATSTVPSRPRCVASAGTTSTSTRCTAGTR